MEHHTLNHVNLVLFMTTALMDATGPTFSNPSAALKVNTEL